MSNQQDGPAGPAVTSLVPPIEISATTRSESSIKVIWGYMAGGGHTGTRLKWRTAAVPVGEFDVPIEGKSYVITGLSPGTRYHVQAFGLRGSEVSPVSRDVEATTHPATSPPPQPTNLAATAAGNAMTLTWSGVANASSYKLAYGLAPDGAVIGTASVSLASHAFTGLSAGTGYYFEVRASNTVGDSSPVRIVKQTLPLPAAPTGLQATPAATSLAVQWSAVSGAVDYVIRHGTEPGGAATTLTTRQLRETLTGLTPSTLYYLQVSARNGNGESVPARITQKTLDAAALPPRPGSLHVDTTHDRVTIIWAPPQSAQYVVSIGIDNPQREVLARELSPYMNHRFQQMRPDTRYFIEVRATNAVGESEPSISGGTTRAFPAPQGLTFSEVTDGSALMRWSGGPDYSAQTLYEVYLDNRHLATLAQASYRLSGLTEQTEYLFRVRAKGVGQYGLGDYFSAYTAIRFTTAAYTGIRICRPGNLRGDRISARQVVLSWDEPYATCALCPDAVGYEISGAGISTIEVARPPYTINGLSINTAYRFQVRARATVNNISIPTIVLVPPFTGTPAD